jgi:hypothetical protein
MICISKDSSITPQLKIPAPFLSMRPFVAFFAKGDRIVQISRFNRVLFDSFKMVAMQLSIINRFAAHLA